MKPPALFIIFKTKMKTMETLKLNMKKYLLPKHSYFECKAENSFLNYKFLMNALRKAGLESEMFPFEELSERIHDVLELVGLNMKDLPESPEYHGDDMFDYVDETGVVVLRDKELYSPPSGNRRPESKVVAGLDNNLYKVYYYHDGTPIEIEKL